MHLVLQDPCQSLHLGMRVGRAVSEPLEIARSPRPGRGARVAAALEEVGLQPAADLVGRYPTRCPGVSARASHWPVPSWASPSWSSRTSRRRSLDASLRVEVLSLITTIRDTHGTAFVVVTHDLALARYVADRVAVLQHGRLVEVGDTEQVVTSPRHACTRTLLAASESVR